MRKIPVLFKRVFEDGKFAGIADEITPGCESYREWIPTAKFDGICCAIIGGELYRRYDAKKGKPVPEGAIKCQDEPDPVTGHFPCWVKCDRNNPADKWLWAAYDRCKNYEDGTYEAIGEHFQGNVYNLDCDILLKHGKPRIIDDFSSFEKIREYLAESPFEGIVFWHNGEPKCKIRRKDFGFEWPIK